MKRFFGEFLVAAGRIDSGQLHEALETCDQVNLRIGELAIREGWLTQGQVQEVLAKQRLEDRNFGRIAVAYGYLSEEQFQVLLHRRSETHLYVGEALVRMSALTVAELEADLAAYQAESSTEEANERVPIDVYANPVSKSILEALPRISSRIGRVQLLTHWAPEGAATEHWAYRRWILIDCLGYLAVGLAFSNELAKRIAAEMLMCNPDALSREEVADAQGELLNMVVGMSKLTLGVGIRDRTRISPPQAADFPTMGHTLYLNTNHGEGCLVLQCLAGAH